MALIDLSDNRNFTIFLVVDFVLSVLITVLGIFIFPFFAWLIKDGFAIEVILEALTTLSVVLLIIWIILSIAKRSKSRKSGKYETGRFPYPVLFVLAFSMICINATNLPIFLGSHADFFDSNDTRWGSCMIVNHSYCCNMFGIEKFKGEYVAPVYDEHGQKKIIRFFVSNGGLDSFNYEGEDVEVQWYRMEIWEYDVHGNYDGKAKTKNLCKWFRLPRSFVNKHNLDGEYFYDNQFFGRWNSLSHSKSELEDIIIMDCKKLLIEQGFVFE